MPRNEMLDEMLDQAVKRIQHSIQHSKTKFVFDLDQTSSNINLQMLNDPTWVVKRIQHFIQHSFSACWMKCWMRLTRALKGLNDEKQTLQTNNDVFLNCKSQNTQYLSGNNLPLSKQIPLSQLREV